MTPACAAAVIILWTSRHFSTADIADLLGLQESAVSRLIIAARSIAREGATTPTPPPQLET